MRVPLRHRLAAVVVAVAAGVLAAPAPHAAAGPLCPNGTNWDSVQQRCR